MYQHHLMLGIFIHVPLRQQRFVCTGLIVSILSRATCSSTIMHNLRYDFHNCFMLCSTFPTDLQSQVSELTKTITQLTSQLTSEKLSAEEVKGQLETARTELALKIEGVALADNSLAEVSAQFESSVREMNEKADFLSSALDKESELRSLAQEEVGVVRGVV